ncbi:hypothetical protein [Streptomyces sp. NPDC059071]|uniref:hypothetical protein n=1 Tax=unclassified Streptomyces TaxID=2593676 RepID=UPI003666319A
MELLGKALFVMVPLALGVALLVDFKGFRRYMISRPGESDEDIKRYQPIAIIVGAGFVCLPLTAVGFWMIY